jgi:glycosyltransferase involved in cell wall biosynthesis
MRKLHVIFLAGWYPSKIMPYNGDFIQRHAEAVATIHKITVLHVITNPKQHKLFIEEKNDLNGVNTYITYIKSSVFKPVLFYWAFQKMLRKIGNYDIIHVNILYPVGLIALINKLLYKKKYLITEHHNIYQLPYRNSISWIRNWISKWIAKNADFICPVTQNLAFAMQEMGLKSNYKPIPNVVNTKLFKQKKNIRNEKFSLLHVSGLDDVKRVDIILETIAKLQNHISDFIFYLIGNNASKYSKKINALGINHHKIKLIDHLNHDELIKYYESADLFLLFSESENLPCVILESFSVGTPVVSSDVGGINEYFPPEFGLLVNKDNSEDFLNAILEIYNKKEIPKPDEMHQFVELNFSPVSIASSFSNLYIKMLQT